MYIYIVNLIIRLALQCQNYQFQQFDLFRVTKLHTFKMQKMVEVIIKCMVPTCFSFIKGNTKKALLLATRSKYQHMERTIVLTLKDDQQIIIIFCGCLQRLVLVGLEFYNITRFSSQLILIKENKKFQNHMKCIVTGPYQWQPHCRFFFFTPLYHNDDIPVF